MTSVSALFYTRRTRLGRTTSDSDDLGFLSSDRFHDSNSSRRHRANSRKTACTRSDSRRICHRSDHHNRQSRHAISGEFDESGRSLCHPRQHLLSSFHCLDIPPIQQVEVEGVIEAPIRNSFGGDTSDSIRVRFNSNERLPRSVLLARERLVQRLRGVSLSSARESQETHPGTHFDNYWFNNSENWQNINVEENSFLTDSTLPASRQLHESVSDPSLHHELFTKAADNDSKQKFRDSDECCICLDRYAEGNKLTSLQCGHRFHSSCLSPWLQTCTKCPYCRSEISNH